MKSNRIIMVLLIVALAFTAGVLTGTEARAEGDPIAWVKKISGQVIVKSNGKWGNDAVVGMPLFSMDKVVTKDGKVTIEFHDGAITHLFRYTNLLIQEEIKTSWFGFSRKKVKRSLRLLLGKARVITAKVKGVDTQLATATSVCGLRGTDVTFSLDEHGQPYIMFSDGTGTNLDDFINGVADIPPDIAAELADSNEAQRAAYLADAAARQAEASASAGDAQAAYDDALAAAAASAEIVATAEQFVENADQETVDMFNELIGDAQDAMADAKNAMDQALEDGATATTFRGLDGSTVNQDTIMDSLDEGIDSLDKEVDQRQLELDAQEVIDEMDPDGQPGSPT